ncbi:NAD-dependent epimerase [Streptomyces malaysiensis subsp. malaysiensis]|uniref:NAD-dependent epimerase/dehydratase family protein n=1 Tax=Streptomyces malaysiensis TaxID=92644 RepID=UPI000BFDB1C0|nr:NAD-dependent epimerase/dehydratase family protein [Streptomyces malaysiensis]ATL87910.1 putative NAD dependent epimerase/dehydratase family protein [Streptomyces malaysiensis]QDL68741.1 NAD-dependent epimerase [Streptomyces malaysiensis]
MNILVTGATGYLGRAVAQRLHGAGHQVTAMARGEAGLKALAAGGFRPVRGDLTDPVSLRTAVEDADAVVETGDADNDRATEALLELIAGTGKRYLRTSGVGVYTELSGGEPSDTVHTEDTDFVPIPELSHRYNQDLRVMAAARNGAHTVVLRPGMVYGQGGSEQLPLLLRAALRDQVSRYTGQGLNRYPNVYLDDVARAYILALESAPPGSEYNLAADEATMREIAEGIAEVLGLGEAVSTTLEDMAKAIGPRYAMGMAGNVRVNATKARTELGWAPQGPSLTEDLVHGSYRKVWGHREVSLVTEAVTP